MGHSHNMPHATRQQQQQQQHSSPSWSTRWRTLSALMGLFARVSVTKDRLRRARADNVGNTTQRRQHVG
jgi:hypothetical protein